MGAAPTADVIVVLLDAVVVPIVVPIDVLVLIVTAAIDVIIVVIDARRPSDDGHCLPQWPRARRHIVRTGCVAVMPLGRRRMMR